MKRSGVLLFGLTLTMVAACSSTPGFEPCSGDVALSVVRLDPPQISWEPGCGVDFLRVDDAANRTMWSIRSAGGDNSLVPTVTYGVVPGGAIEDFTPREFQHGNGYVVRIWRLRREADGDIQSLEAGEVFFRW